MGKTTGLVLTTDKVLDMSRNPAVYHGYRFRVWRGEKLSLVLMQPASPSCPPPDLYSAQAANLVTRCFLGFSVGPHGGKLSWYEHSPIGCFFVSFRSFGHDLRQTLYGPMYLRKPFRSLAKTVGIDPDEESFGNHRQEEGHEADDEDFEIHFGDL